MKRDPRLHGLSSEHHHALVLSRELGELTRAGRVDEAIQRLLERFAGELEPHFRVEEELLLPALREAGEAALVQRTEEDHAALRAHVAAVAAGQIAGLAMFAERLVEHVRFEERELFPSCEARLGGSVLDEVFRRAPKGS